MHTIHHSQFSTHLEYDNNIDTLKHILDDYNLWKLSRDVERQYIRSNELHIQHSAIPFSNAYPLIQAENSEEHNTQSDTEPREDINAQSAQMPSTSAHPMPCTPAHRLIAPSPHTCPEHTAPVSASPAHNAHISPSPLLLPMGSAQSPSTSGNERNSDWTTT